MEGRHIDLSLQNIREEQQSLNQAIESLLCFVPAASSSATVSKNKIDATHTPVHSNRGRGRPSKIRVPPSSPVPTNLSREPALESIIECMNKLNEQNKRLLNYVEHISENLEKHSAECQTEHVSASNENELTPTQKTLIDGVSDRLEKIEQNINSNILICRGPGLSELISGSIVGTATNLDSLKGRLCESICGDEIAGVDIAICGRIFWGKIERL